MIFNDIRLGRAADQDFSDLTTAKKTGPARWVGENTLEVPFDRALTASEEAAIRRRLTTVDADEETKTRDMETALADLNAALATQSGPTNKQLGQALAVVLGVNLKPKRGRPATQ